jgi:1-acyl-sn-glycerol-3-phosphate acyltransferase
MFDPKTNKYPYTEFTDGHYIHTGDKYNHEFNKDYPYVETSKWHKFKSFWFKIFFNVIVIPVSNTRLGLRVKGRKNLKAHRETIKNGIISCCNHVHYWDFLGIYYGVRHYQPNFLVWDKNINGGFGPCMRLLGGIPIPEHDLGGQKRFTKEVRGLLSDKQWLHIYSEGSMWEYYRPIRPFKRGLAVYAIKCDKPILPMAFTYRRPNWVRRTIFRQIAVFTLNIGEPIYRNKDLPYDEQERDLITRAHEAVCRLAGFADGENIYEPIFNNSKRIEY